MNASRRRQWIARAAVMSGIALGLAVGVWHYAALYSSLTGARDDLLAVERRLGDVGVDVQQPDLDEARVLLASVQSRTARARLHLDRDPLLQLGRHVPAAGAQIEAVYDLVGMSSTVAELGGETIALGERIVEARSGERAEPLTEFAVGLLEELEPRLLRLGELTSQLVDERLALGDAALLPPLDAARTRLDERLPDLAVAIERGLDARTLVPTVLGFEAPRRYLVIALNNAEILPGGGLVSVAGVLELSNGRPLDLEFTGAGRWKPAWEALGGEYITPPGPLGRYLLQDFSWNLPTSNWSPDFPTWPRQALEFYELAWGEQGVDGIVTVDLDVLEGLLRVTGPRQLRTGDDRVITLNANNAVLELERVSRRPFERDGDRKAPVGDFAALMLRDVLRLPADRWDELTSTLGKLSAERHIQMFMFDPDEQALVTALGWSGRLEPVEGDYVQLNEASLNSTKLNLIIFPEGSHHIEVTPLGDARHELRLRYSNPLAEWAAGKDPELVRRLMLRGQYGAYLRVLAPDGAVDFAVEIDGVPAGIEDIGREGAYPWFGVFMPVQADTTREITFRWTVPLATRAAEASSYQLFMQKQPGTRGMCLDVTVSRDGQPARSIELDGGTVDDAGRICLTTDVEVRAEF